MKPLRTIQIAAPKPNPFPIASKSLASAMLTPMAEPSKNNNQLAVITKNSPAMMAPQLIKDRQRGVSNKLSAVTITIPPCVKQKKRMPSPWHDIKNEQGLYHGKRTEKRSRADLASTVRVTAGIPGGNHQKRAGRAPLDGKREICLSLDRNAWNSPKPGVGVIFVQSRLRGVSNTMIVYSLRHSSTRQTIKAVQPV